MNKMVWIAEVTESSTYWYSTKIELVDWPHSSVKKAKWDLWLFKSLTKRKNPLRIVTVHDDID